VKCVPGDAPFPQRGGDGMWIPGVTEWKVGFELGLTRV
jgi:hypothetical protein